MVTAKLIVSHQGMRVDLPRAATGGAVQDMFSVALGADGATQVNGRTLLDDDAIRVPAQAAAVTDREVRAVIEADGRVQHARVMHVLDVLRQAGISRVAFATVPAPPRNPLVREAPR